MTLSWSLGSLALLAAFEDGSSMSEVAKSLGVSQPTVSANLRRLEEALGVRLVDLSPQGSALTETGAAAVAWSRPLLAEARRLDAAFASMGRASRRRLRIAASLTIAEYLVPRWLSNTPQERVAFTWRDLELTVCNSRQVVASVEANGVDLGFVEGAVSLRKFNRRLIGRDELRLIVAPNHEWARRARPISAVELCRGDLILREEGSGTRGILERALARHGVELPDGLPTTTSTSSIKNAVRYGGKVAVVSQLAIGDEVASGSLVTLATDGLDLARHLYAIWPRAYPGHSGISGFVANARRKTPSPASSSANSPSAPAATTSLANHKGRTPKK